MNYQIILEFRERVEADGGNRVAFLAQLAFLIEHMTHHRDFLCSIQHGQNQELVQDFFRNIEELINVVDSKYHLLTIKDMVLVLGFFVEILYYGLQHLNIFLHVQDFYLVRVQNYFMRLREDELRQNMFQENLERLGHQFDLRQLETQTLFLKGTGYERDPIFFDTSWLMNMLRISVKFKSITEPIIGKLMFIWRLDSNLIYMSETLSERIKFMQILYLYANSVRLTSNCQRLMGFFLINIIESDEVPSTSNLVSILRCLCIFGIIKFENHAVILEFVEQSIAQVYLNSSILELPLRFELLLSIIQISKLNSLPGVSVYLGKYLLLYLHPLIIHLCDSSFYSSHHM